MGSRHRRRLSSLRDDGKLQSDIDPDDLAITLLATLQGGLFSPRYLGLPVRSKLRSIPFSPWPSADD